MNYLKITFRNLIKDRVYSIINITGLALAISFSFYIYSWVRNERSYDRFNEKVDQIYRLTAQVSNVDAAVTPYPMWVMNRWLSDFAYRIDIQWWMFGLAGLIAIGVALLTVGFQAIKAAVANPVDSLRSE